MSLSRREFASRMAIAAGALSAGGLAAPLAVAQSRGGQSAPAPLRGMAAFYAALADNEAELAAINPEKRREIVMLAYPGMFPLDLIGPHAVLSGLPNTRVQIAWKSKDPLPFQGFSVVPHATLEECPADLDVLFVPGGGLGTFTALNDDGVLEFLQTRGPRAQHITSVCTGSLVLGAAGLLQGRRATTHWVAFDALAQLGAIPVKERVVEDGNVMTAAGVSAGIDFAIQLTAQMTTENFAKAMQLNIEYDPQPKYDAGAPEGAGPRVTGALQDMYAPLLAGGSRMIASRKG